MIKDFINKTWSVLKYNLRFYYGNLFYELVKIAFSVISTGIIFVIYYYSSPKETNDFVYYLPLSFIWACFTRLFFIKAPVFSNQTHDPLNKYLKLNNVNKFSITFGLYIISIIELLIIYLINLILFSQILNVNLSLKGWLISLLLILTLPIIFLMMGVVLFKSLKRFKDKKRFLMYMVIYGLIVSTSFIFIPSNTLNNEILSYLIMFNPIGSIKLITEYAIFSSNINAIILSISIISFALYTLGSFYFFVKHVKLY